MNKISTVFIQDLLKNKAVIGYLILFAVLGWGVFIIESQPEKAILVLLQVVLLVQPLITIVFATIYYYNSQEFILLLSVQPLKRKTLIQGLFTGLAGTFSLAFLLGTGLPVLVFAPTTEGAFLIIAGILLNLVFIAIALLVSVSVYDKARGMGIALIVWAFFAFIYDGLLLFIMYQFSAYPIEEPILVLSFLNPVDIARILVIMKTDASALLGLSGAVFQDFFGSTKGIAASITALLLWTLIPSWFMYKKFKRKDL